jgi:hypothetical protein
MSPSGDASARWRYQRWRTTRITGDRPEPQMQLFADILLSVTLPIMALIALGGGLQRKLALDVGSLNRLQVYVVLPCFLVHFLSTGAQPLSAIGPTAVFTLVQLALLLAIGWLTVLVLGVGRRFGPLIGLATAYANSGFFGIPVAELAFGRDYVLHQSVVVSGHSILVVTAGVWLLSGSSEGLIGRLRSAFETPMIPAILLGLALKGFELQLPAVIGSPIELLSRIFTPLALFTLGAQIAETKAGDVPRGPLALAVVLKLAVAPLVTLGLARVMALPEDIADLLVVAAAAPVGVILTIFALQFRNHGELATSAVLVSTILSPLTVTAWILLTRLT